MKPALAFLAIVALAVLSFAAAEPWPASDVLQPAPFAALLKSKGPKPPVYYVGFNVLYRSKHIPGAVYAGPGAQSAGLALFEREISGLPRDKELVIYCGCCPIDKCPNLRPAYAAAKRLGFQKVRVLMLPTSFGIDWVEKGYPFETGTSGAKS